MKPKVDIQKMKRLVESAVNSPQDIKVVGISTFTCPKCGYTWKPRVYPPNYCANPKCKRPLSEKAKKVAFEAFKRYALKKIKDKEKFKNMWEAGVPIKEIAKEFNISYSLVPTIRSALGLIPRPSVGNWIFYNKKRAEENERMVIEHLKKCGGYCDLRKLRAKVPVSAIKRLLHKRLIFRISFNLGRQPGGYKRGIHKDVFKKSVFIRNRMKTFICVDRTAVVRLMCKSLKKPKNKDIQKITSAFLRRYLTKAERVAVLWKLGVRSFAPSQIKRNMKVDGVIGPIRSYRS